jgi:outer membrane lipoprotein carrier protein
MVALATRLAAQDIGSQVVHAASNSYRSLTNFQAEFRQHFDDKMLPEPDGRGTLYQEGKNRFAMRFSDPAGDAIVSDGNRLWVYLPSTSPGKVLRFALPSHPTYATDLLGTFLDNAADRYRITYIRAEAIDGHMTDAVLMEPTSNDMPFRRATIWFDRESHLPRRLEIEESRDHKRILELHNLQINLSIPPSTFVCNPPKSVKVVDQ